MLHNLGCSPTRESPHEQCALLHTPGHVAISTLLQGVAGAGPGAGGGAELLAGGGSITITATTDEETLLDVAIPAQHQPGQLAGEGGPHLCGVSSTTTTGYQAPWRICNINPLLLFILGFSTFEDP